MTAQAKKIDVAIVLGEDDYYFEAHLFGCKHLAKYDDPDKDVAVSVSSRQEVDDIANAGFDGEEEGASVYLHPCCARLLA